MARSLPTTPPPARWCGQSVTATSKASRGSPTPGRSTRLNTDRPTRSPTAATTRSISSSPAATMAGRRCGGGPVFSRRRRRSHPSRDTQVRQLTPMELAQLGRVLVLIGALILLFGVLLVVGDRVPFIGRLPGDITLRGDGWTVYAPLATSILLSVLLTAVLSLAAWLRR